MPFKIFYAAEVSQNVFYRIGEEKNELFYRSKTVVSEIDHGIDHKLPRTVESEFSAAPDVVNRNITNRLQKILLFAAKPRSIDWFMLQKQNRANAVFCNNFVSQIFLKFKNFTVIACIFKNPVRNFSSHFSIFRRMKPADAAP